jgi:hypothetical protein
MPYSQNVPLMAPRYRSLEILNPQGLKSIKPSFDRP